MRCKNCGWENPANLTRCEKCGTALEGEVQYQAAPSAPVQNYNKTVNEAVAFPDSPVQEGSHFCTKCGYPLRPGTLVCPNCHAAVTEVEAAPSEPAKPVGTGTVNPWVKVAAGAACSFEPVAQEGTPTPEVIKLKGEAHELKRDNLDPDNQTITSKVQANLTFENGQWFIEDKSAQQTTFIHANGKAALKDGDVVLMGNRQFIFHAE